MVQRPGSLPEFEARFPDDEACARRLFGKRWPDGFRCPGCGHAKGWGAGPRHAARGMRAVPPPDLGDRRGPCCTRSHLPLKLWFLAAWLVATHKNGMSARQLWLQLGLGKNKTARLLLRKLRRAMVDPEREPLKGLVEVDETSLSFNIKDDPVTAQPGRSHEGRLLIAGAVEIVGKGPGRVRLTVIWDDSAATLNAFVAGNVAAGSTVVSDGWSGYATLTDVKHDPRVIGDAPVNSAPPWIDRSVRQREAVGAGGLPRAAPAAPPDLPRRVRLPVQPPAQPRRRLRAPARPQPHPPARHLPDADQPELTGEAVQRDQGVPTCDRCSSCQRSSARPCSPRRRRRRGSRSRWRVSSAK